MVAACERIDRLLRSRAEFAHTSHLRVEIDDLVVFDAHYRGPYVGDIFSVTKSVLATLVGIAVRERHITTLDIKVRDLLDLPLGDQTLRHLLTMTRGCRTDGPFDIDSVTALPHGWVERIASAPAISEPGSAFCYDDGGAHLLGAALARLLGEPLSVAAQRMLFTPLGITDWFWPRDPDGCDYGHCNLRLSATALGRLGRLWMQHGLWNDHQLVDPHFLRAMLTRQAAGGRPENRPYGYLIWIDPTGPLAAGWAGQHVHVLPAAHAVIVTTGDPRYDPGPPSTNHLHPHWRPAHDLVLEQLLPALTPPSQHVGRVQEVTDRS